MKTLKEMVMEISNNIKLKEGRTKGQNIEIENKIITITDYEFVKNNDNEYAVYVIKELPDFYFYSGMMLTEQLKLLDGMGAKDQINTEGLPLRLVPRKSNAGRAYYSVEFYPGK